LKYFKKNTQQKEKKNKNKKLYAQVMTSSSTVKEILKIKETFPNLQVKKIETIQRVIQNDSNTKPKINMTTMGPSRKQVIVLMSNENKTKFMELSSNYITNLNRLLKDIKSEVLANFVCCDNIGINIVTNKVASPLDLQTTKKYVKNSNLINVDNVDVP